MYPLEIEMRDIFPISRATLSADISAQKSRKVKSKFVCKIHQVNIGNYQSALDLRK